MCLLKGKNKKMNVVHWTIHGFAIQHSDNSYTAEVERTINCANILQAAFVPISFRQKITNPNCKHIKAAQNTFIQKSCS